MLVITRKEISESITIEETMEAVKAAYQDYEEGSMETPDRVELEIREHEGINLIMASYFIKKKVFGFKDVSVFVKNRDKGKPVINSLVILHDAETGEPIMIADGIELTAIKTGAATGVVTDIMAKTKAEKIALIGAGFQAMRQLEAILAVRPGIKEICVYDVNREKSEEFTARAVERMSGYNRKFVLSASANEAVSESDIITTVTTSKSPVFDGKAIKKGVHINAVGSFTPEMQEIDEYLVQAADKIVIDSRQEGLTVAGDLLVPIKKGIVTEKIVYAEVGEILTRKKEGRVRDEEITIFESIGLAALDIAVAEKTMRLKMDGNSITLIDKLVKGDKLVSDLKLKFDIAEGVEKACLQAIKDARSAVDSYRSLLAWKKAEMTGQ